MDFLVSLNEFLKSQQILTDIVGDNIYPLFIPQYDKIPAITYYPVSTKYHSELGNDNNFVRMIIQFDCHEKTFKKARKLSRIIKNLFQNFCGNMKGTNIQATFIRTDLVMNNASSNRFDTEDTIHVIEVEFYYNES